MNTLNLTLFPYCLIILAEIHLSRKKWNRAATRARPYHFQIHSVSIRPIRVIRVPLPAASYYPPVFLMIRQ
jgi:hypothetical protein